jgi:hypothetical protein
LQIHYTVENCLWLKNNPTAILCVCSGGRGGGGWRMEEDDYEEEERMRRELHAREQFLRQRTAKNPISGSLLWIWIRIKRFMF